MIGGWTYGEYDGGLGCKLGRNVDVHLDVCGVLPEVVDAGESAIGSRKDGD
jgi:hypothetical protein